MGNRQRFGCSRLSSSVHIKLRKAWISAGTISDGVDIILTLESTKLQFYVLISLDVSICWHIFNVPLIRPRVRVIK
jgi:hypothetical protein